MAATRIKQLRVLLAEDNPVNQLFATRLIERQGHIVRVVSNGQLALNAIRHEKFDVVLMDIGMPLMDGFEAVSELRQLEKQTGCHLPVIAMTANAMPVDRGKCLAVGMDDFVSKPVQAADLAAAMTRVFQATPQAQADIETPFGVDTETNETPACDLAAALQKNGGDKIFLKELVQLFLDTIPAQLQSLQTAMQGRDRKLIGDVAHSVKGSVRHFLAAPAYDSAQQLEMISRSGDMAVIEQTYEQLRSEVQRLRTRLLGMLFSLREASPDSGA